MNSIIREAKILIVDDNEENIAVIEQMLRRAGYHRIYSTVDSRQTMSQVESVGPDMLILDLLMPPPDGFAILDELTLSARRDKLMAILVLTCDAAAATKVRFSDGDTLDVGPGRTAVSRGQAPPSAAGN